LDAAVHLFGCCSTSVSLIFVLKELAATKRTSLECNSAPFRV
jgi:hypothetical protein